MGGRKDGFLGWQKYENDAHKILNERRIGLKTPTLRGEITGRVTSDFFSQTSKVLRSS